jgi:hypothetical protein
MKHKSGLLLALFTILLITSTIVFLYGIGVLIVYLIASLLDDYPESNKTLLKLKYNLSIGLGLAGMILFTVLLTYFYK